MKAEVEKKKEAEKKKQKKKGWCSFFNLHALIAEIKDFIVQIIPKKTNESGREDESLRTQLAILKQLKEMLKVLKKDQTGDEEDVEKGDGNKIISSNAVAQIPNIEVKPTTPVSPIEPIDIPMDNFDDPDWLKYSEDLGSGKTEKLPHNEREFWVKFVRKYLRPLDKDKKTEEEMKKKVRKIHFPRPYGKSICTFMWPKLNSVFTVLV